MTKPVISVILPTFQPEDYILDCLNSLSKQTLSFGSFEVIIILNGERDPYFETIEKHLKGIENKIHVQLLFTDDKGVSNARNIGLNASIGNFITFLDDDDFVSSNYLSSLYNNTGEGVITCSNVKTFDGQTYGRDYLSNAFKKCSSGTYSIFRYRHFLSGISGKLIPKSVIGPTQFKSKLAIGEDSVFLFELSKRIDKMNLTKEDAYYIRRIRVGSARMIKKSGREHCSNFFKLITAYSKIYFSSPFSYNLLLYLSRIAAAVRSLGTSILRKKN